MLKNFWLTLAARVVYGILLPGFLLFLALSSHFGLVQERQILDWQQKMHDSLDNLANYHDDDRFFHGLLQSNFAAASTAGDPFALVAGRISTLKKHFPGQLRFIILDADGKIVPRLSDENRFNYVFKNLNQSLRQPGLVYQANRINLLRGYFGQFLMEKHLELPLRQGYLGRCLRVSEDPQKALLWYQTYQNLTIVCLIRRDLLDQQTGPRMMIDRFNRSSADIRLGFYDPSLQTVYGFSAAGSSDGEIAIEATAYANSAIEFRKTAGHLLLFRQVAPRLVIFSSLDQRQHLVDPDHEVGLRMFGLLKWLLVTAFIVSVLSLHASRLFLSVRQKLMLLFLFANGLPLMILLATGYEFFEQKKSSLTNSVHEHSSRLIKDFDTRYPAGRELMAERFNRFINENSRKGVYGVWPASVTARLASLIELSLPDESYLFNSVGEQILKQRELVVPGSYKFIRDFFLGALEFFNSSSDHFVATRRTMLEQISDEASVFHGVLRQIGLIEPQNYGSGLRWTYLNLLGDRENHNSWGLVLVAWKPEALQRAYINEQLAALNRRIAPRKLLVMELESGRIFPESAPGEKKLRRIMHRTQSRKMLADDNLLIDGEAYVATALKGIELSDAVIMAIYPKKIIDGQVDSLFERVSAAAAASLFLVLLIVAFFSRRLLVPVAALANGMRAIARHDFKNRIDYVSEDEFGQLIRVFNETTAGMQDLAIGTAVQKSLLPPADSRVGKVLLYARSEFMSKMGGDYFDYFELANQRLGVFFGDVAGHGIPAALIMSMAKAVVANARTVFASPADLLMRANSVFLHLKSRGWKRMMTAQCLELDCNTGDFRLANAGQCYPVIVSADRRSITYVKAVGMPLGNVTRKPYAEVSGQLKPGDTLILYTDGIIEATSATGEVFDFARFEKLLLASWNADLETWWQDIFKGYSAWAAAQDDDITMLMLKYE
ncbi:MAG TPA: SpoIIE family protein phosphatase [Candidatus Rifleibacterium sp.]|nr:SpoIIE family protein phosphatase [Candidatus Rifleibacterium sp.]HPT44838.1 SpoIIE family protein phosphatase [Candidatus Rifleibacterium sp.]